VADNPLLITNTDISGVLKNVYASFRINAFPKLTPLLANVKKGRPGGPERMRWGGNGVYWDVLLTRPVGMSASDAGFFPPTAQVQERQANLGIKRTYVRRQIDALAIAGTSDKEAAFIPLARKLVVEAMDAAQLGQQTVLHGDGTGILSVITTVTDTTHVIVQHPYGISAAGEGGLLHDIGQFIAVYGTGITPLRGTATITAVSNSGDSATLTLDTAISSMVGGAVGTGDVIVAANTATDDSSNKVPNGLTNVINRGGSYASFEGITQASFARWDTIRFVAGTDTPDATQPTEMDLWALIVKVAGKSGKDAGLHPDEFLVLTTPGIEKALAESFLGQRVWESDDQAVLKGGFKAVRIMGIPVVRDYWCPAGTLYLLHLPSLTWVDRQDWVKLQYEDSGPWRFIAGRDAYEINFGSYWNFGALQRNALGLITGYTDTVRYAHTM
jgi:hypothetical protein